MTIPCSLLTGMPLGQENNNALITHIETLHILRHLWERQHRALNIIFGGARQGLDGYKAFFCEVLPVLPNKYRPITFVDGTK